MIQGNEGKPAYAPCRIAEGTSGEWSIRRLVLPPRLVEIPDSRPQCFRYRPGEYTELRRGGITFMTDLYDEWWTQRTAIERARKVGGSVLITGLGLGLVAREILADPEHRAAIEAIVILEQSADVIRLVGPQLRAELGPCVSIIEADAYTWVAESGSQFDTVWHDIWPDPMASEVDAEMAALRAQHAPWSRWQGFWPEDYRVALAA
jgi:hypothetical protein